MIDQDKKVFSKEEFFHAFYPQENRGNVVDTKEIGKRIGRETVKEVFDKVQIPIPTNFPKPQGN